MAAQGTQCKRAKGDDVMGDQLAVGFAKGAELLDVSTKTLRRAAADGRLKTIRLGRRRLIAMAELERLLSGTRRSLKNGSKRRQVRAA